MQKKITSGMAAGICVSLGGAVFLAVEDRVVGAVLFSVALLSICLKGYSLFTGKVGFLLEDHGKDAVTTLLLALLGNAIATVLCGLILRAAMPHLGQAAQTLCEGKLTQPWWGTLIRGCFCGILMYLAVSTWRENKTLLDILFCIPVFILSGFEHSIADIFYFAAASAVSLQSILFICLVILGNSLGALILPLLGSKRP